uniref:Phospholipase/carboxylesterase/thioesterase domain-containing protein n=1 Tax=Hyaloperonospora arabidopsidis (strain Emoy2) TaxID=559515 RepID=M4C0G3_HYAAE
MYPYQEESKMVRTDKKSGYCCGTQYDLKSLSRADGDNADGIDTSRDRIMAIIDNEVTQGIPLSRIVLGGFSQGAALSLFSGYQTKTVLGGVVSMSGFLPRFSSFQVSPETANVPLLMCHGEQDPVVRFEYGKMSKEKLETAGVKDVEFHSYPDMEHSACMEELSDVTKWLQRVIPATKN